MNPKITVNVLTHFDSVNDVLMTCLESLKRSEGVDLDVILMSTRETSPDVPNWVNLIEVPRETNPQHVLNIGMRSARKDSEFIVEANDDLIFSKHALAMMARFAKNKKIMLNPISNCDNHWLYVADFHIRNKEGLELPTKRQYKEEEVKGFEEHIMNMEAGYDVAISVPMLPTYATLCNMETYKLIGEHDERFILGYADTDLSCRAHQLGIARMIHLGAFVFHYSGLCTAKSSNDAIRANDVKIFDSKYGEGAHKRYI